MVYIQIFQGFKYYILLQGDMGSSSYAGCECLPGWTGDQCEQEFDGCAITHCYSGENYDNKYIYALFG